MLNVRLNLRKVAAIAACLAVTMGFASCEKDDDGTKVPGAVMNFTATAGNGQVSLTWEVPSDDGGTAITGYVVTNDNWVTKVTKTASELSHTYTGLTNDTEYEFKVRAVNAKGDGAESVQKATPMADSSGEEGNDITASDLLLPEGYGWVLPQGSFSTGFIFYADGSVKTLVMSDNNWSVSGTQSYQVEGNKVTRYVATVVVNESIVTISNDGNTLYIRDITETSPLAYQKTNVGIN